MAHSRSPSSDSLDRRRFEIPTRDEDLMVDNAGYYVVRDADMDTHQVARDLQAFKSKLNDNNNWMALPSHFDAFFSLAKYNSEIEDWKLRLDAVDLLLDCFDRVMSGPLPDCVGNVLNCEGIPAAEIIEECSSISDVLLMIVYILQKLTSHFETELLRRERANGAKKGRKGPDLDQEMARWVRLRKKVLASFIRICDLCAVDREGKTRQGAVKYLWRPPEADKGMVRSFIECVFKFLEHPDNVRAVQRGWLTDVFRLARLICIKFDFFHRLGGALVEKTIHLEFMKEATLTSYPFIDAIIGAGVNNDMDPLLSHMLHYVGNLGTVDFGKTSPKPYALLLQTMAEKAPQVMVKHLTAIVVYLENDPPMLRSSVLSTFSELISSDVLSPENCQKFSRLLKSRDKMLDKLMDHLADQNAQVRTKVVNLWTKLTEKQKIPLERFKAGLITKIGQRLLDKSVNVRKAAVHFMSAFLTNNPYGHDFSYNLHRGELARLMRQREVLEKRNPEYDGVKGAERMFAESSEQIKEIVEEWVMKHMEGTAELMDIGDANVNDLVSAVISQLMPQMVHSVRLFVQLVCQGKVDSIKPAADSTPEQVIVLIMENLQEMFIHDRVATRIEDNEELLEDEERKEDYGKSIEKNDQSIDFLKNKLVVELELEECVPTALRAVIQGELAEMKEGIRFVVQCKNFTIRGADRAVRSLCSLIWRRNTDIKNEVVDAATKMFYSSHKDPQIRNKSTADNLLNVIEGMGEEERGCVEEVICEMAAGTFPEGVLKNIWNVVAQGVGQKKLVALRLLTILARADKDGLRTRLRSFQRIIRETNNSTTIRAEALAAIANLASARLSSEPMEPVFRIPCKDSLFATLEKFVMSELLSPESDHPLWFNVIQSVLSIYFDLAKDTCLVVGRLVSKALWYTRRVTEWVIFYDEESEKEKDEAMKAALKERCSHWKQMWLLVSERMLSLSGELALRCVVHADVTYIREVKRLPDVVQMVKKKEILASAAPDRPLKEWEWRGAVRKGLFDFSEKDEHNPHGTSDEERVRSRSDNILDSRLLRPGRILARLLPFVMYSLRAESSPPAIRNAAALAFSKFMLVSRDLAERGAPLFFSLLNNAEYPSLRGNLMLAAGDLCFRAPNMVERYAQDVYAMTKDSDSRVRETSILVLTHLTTNQMLKYRGSLADVARCYLDKSVAIQTLTREFFQELSTKGSVVYNLMPDFISRLSRNSKEVSLNEFRVIMGYLIGLLKDKHADSLVEKLCHRFEFAKSGHGTAKNKHLAHYFSFCISQFQLSDKSLYKVRDALPAYSSFMEDDRIYQDFVAALQPLIKTTKSTDVKADAEEFERHLKSLHEKGIRAEDIHAAKRMNEKKAQRQATKRGKGGGRVVASRGKKVRAMLPDSDDVYSGSD